jgi:multiple sugar transport system substrate-binding protein
MTEKRVWKRLDRLGFVFALLMLLLSFPQVGTASETVMISYWQPIINATNRNTMNHIVELFESQYPNIRVEYFAKLEHRPPNYYEPGVGEALRNGEGPDVVTLFNGWLPSWVSAGYLIPLPKDAFPPEWIERHFFEIVTSSRYQDQYWALPTAVRTMALFYNKDVFDAANITYPDPSWTWEDMAKIAAQIDAANIEGVVGFDLEITVWGHHWLREVLVPQFGGDSYVHNPNQSIWNSPSACGAFTWLLGLEDVPRTSSEERLGSAGDYFEAGRAALHVDGSFRLQTIERDAPELNFGVVPLPRGPLQNAEGQYQPRTFGSYWTHGLTPHVLEDKARYDAAITFLNFITSPEIGAIWMEETGELAAQRDAVTNDMLADPLRGPFLGSLRFAFATPFADETLQLAALTQAYDSVITENADPCDALNIAGLEVQEILDDFVENQNRWERR